MRWDEETQNYDTKPYDVPISTIGSSAERENNMRDADKMLYAEPEPARMNLEVLQNNLGNCLNIIDNEVMKGYVTKLERMPIIKPDSYIEKDMKHIHFFRISELVYQEDEFSVDKLAMMFQALSNRACTLVLMLKSDGEKTDFYLGARPMGENSAGTLFQMLKQSLLGFFPGSKITEYYDEDMTADMQSLKPGCISAVTCVADYKQEQDAVSNKEFIQGLEKFVYALQGKAYTAVLIADNLKHDDLLKRKHEYEQIYTQISPFANMQMNFTVSDGVSSSMGSSAGLTKSTAHMATTGTSESENNTTSHTVGTTENVGSTDTVTHTTNESEADGKTHTKGITESTSETRTDSISTGTYSGVDMGKINVGVTASMSHSFSSGTTHAESTSDAISKTLTHGYSDSDGHSDSRNYGTSENNGTSRSIGTANTESVSDTMGEAFNLVNSRTLTDTFGTSKGVTLNAQNMTLNLALQRIGKHLERIEECESFGMWNFAAYFLGETAAEIETAANMYKAVVAGNDSGIESSAINTWIDEESIQDLFGYIRNFIHPQFLYRGFSYDEDRNIMVNPSVMVSSNELAIHMGLPRHSIRGLPVVEHTPFAQEVITRRKLSDKKIELGTIYNFGQRTSTDVTLDVNSLSMHTFVTGSTGSGKSNAVYHLLAELKKKEIPFLVVEPAKGEYKNVFKDVRCFGTNPRLGEILRINPFSFPEEVHVLEHIDRIVEIFNVCWPMYAAMPAVLKTSIEQAYISAGWDLDLSENIRVPELYPTFDDVLRELNTTIKNSEYSEETKGDYIGSLSTRLKSLTNGINGRIFVNDEQNMEELFDHSAIIDISRVGAMETKSLIMGLVVLKLQEYRMAKATEMNSPIKHITVLEEAHNLLKKTSTEQGAEVSNIVGKSVEMLTNTIAEIRTYGEGFIIVDQAPNLLDTAAIRNTNTKIVLRLPESIDREITGGAIALKERQLAELSKLPTGVAAVYQNDWQEAVLCTLPKYESFDYVTNREKPEQILKMRTIKRDRLLHLLLKKKLTEQEQKEALREIATANAPAKVRKDLILNIEKRNNVYEWAVADYIDKNYEFKYVFTGTSNCDSLEELSHIISQNIEEIFTDFNEQEMLSIMYYICRVEHEKHPENIAIEQLRKNYLRERVM